MTTLELSVTPQAFDHIQALDVWWRKNRDKSPDLFREELALAFRSIAEAPAIGRRFPSAQGDVCRYLMRATRTHVYYLFDDRHVRVVAVWGGVKGSGPDLTRL